MQLSAAGGVLRALPLLAVLMFLQCAWICRSMRHLLISTPEAAVVWYSNDTSAVEDPDKMVMVYDKYGELVPAQLKMNWLIGPKEVEFPMGLALSREKWPGAVKGLPPVVRIFLYVADPGPGCKRREVLRYELTEHHGTVSVLPDTKTGEMKQVVMRNLCVQWISVDQEGNLYATCEETNAIYKVRNALMRKWETTTEEPEQMYSSIGPNGMQVSSPGGIASDPFFLYWSNKVMSVQTGSVAKGYAWKPAGSIKYPRVVALAKNADAGREFGLCTTANHIFYTEQPSGEEGRLFAVGKNGGPIALIADALKEPRGCGWDGDGTVYVADQKAKYVYSFPGNMKRLRSFKKLKRVVTFKGDEEEPFSVVVFNSGASPLRALRMPAVVFICTMLTLFGIP